MSIMSKILFDDLSVNDQFHYIITSMAGSWMYEAMKPYAYKDSEFIAQFVKEFISNVGSPNMDSEHADPYGIQQFIDDQHDYLLKAGY